MPPNPIAALFSPHYRLFPLYSLSNDPTSAYPITYLFTASLTPLPLHRCLIAISFPTAFPLHRRLIIPITLFSSRLSSHLPQLKPKILHRIIITNPPNQLPEHLLIIRILAVFHPAADQIAENPSEIIMPRI